MLLRIGGAVVTVALLRAPAVGSQQSAEAGLLAWAAEVRALHFPLSHSFSHSNLKSPCVEQGTDFQSPVEIGETEFGRGLLLKRDVPKDSVLLFVPESKALSLDSCAMAPSHKQALQSAIAEQENKHVLLAAALVFERSLGAASAFAPYISALPSESPRNLFSWSRDQLELGLSMLGADKIPESATRCPTEAPCWPRCAPPSWQGWGRGGERGDRFPETNSSLYIRST